MFPHELKVIVSPYLIPPMLRLAQKTRSNNTDPKNQLAPVEHKDIRISAINNIMVMADSKETAPMLVQAGVYEAMKTILDEELEQAKKKQTAAAAENDISNSNNNNPWEGLPILALDVIFQYSHVQDGQ